MQNSLKKIKNYLLIVLLICELPVSGICQLSNPTFTPKGIVDKESGMILLVQNIKNPCGNNVGLGRKKTAFRLRIPSSKLKNFNPSSKYYLNLRFEIEDCKGKRITRNFSMDLGRISKEGEIKNDKDWCFEGASLISFTGFLREIEAQPTCESRLPMEIISSAEDPVSPGDIIELSVGEDGYICPNAQWEWLMNGCGDEYLIQSDGNSKITVTAQTTTTYYLRIRESSRKKPCISYTVNVNEIPAIVEEAPKPVRLPIVVSGLPSEEICPGTNLRLIVSGGLEGNNNRWIWRTNSCTGDIIGKGSILDLKADQSVKVYVSDESDDESQCIESEIKVKIIESPIDLLINNGIPRLSVCEGESVTLVASNFSDNSKYKLKWSDEQNRVLSVKSSVVTVKPEENSTFYLKGEGDCNSSTKTAAIQVEVIKKSKTPVSVNEIKVRGKKYKFSVTGGSLENGATWNWYKGTSCLKSEFLGEGSEIIAKIKKIDALSVRAEGGKCGSSSCYTHSVVNKKKKPKFGFINVGSFDVTFDNLSFTVGSKRIYLRYKSPIKKFDTPYDITKNVSGGYSISNFPNQTNLVYAFNGEKTSIRTGYTGGFMIGGGKIRFYLGGGFGEAQTIWGVDVIQNNNTVSKTQTWGSVKNKYYKGIEAEAGLFIRLGLLNLMGGVSIINDQANGNYIEGNAGIGFTF